MTSPDHQTSDSDSDSVPAAGVLGQCRYDGEDSRQKAVGLTLIVVVVVVSVLDVLLILCVVVNCVAVIALRRRRRRLANSGRTDVDTGAA